METGAWLNLLKFWQTQQNLLASNCLTELNESLAPTYESLMPVYVYLEYKKHTQWAEIRDMITWS